MRWKAKLFRRIMSWFSIEIIEDAIYRTLILEKDHVRRDEMRRMVLRFYGKAKQETTGRLSGSTCSCTGQSQNKSDS